MADWDNLMDPAREALEALVAKGDEMADRIEELEAKLAQAMEWFDEIRQHCANSGRGVPSIDERIIERCEDTAASALAELKGEDRG